MQRIADRFGKLTIVITIAGILSACKQGPPQPASLPGIIVISELYGTADDGDSSTIATPLNHRYRNPQGVSASDGTSSSSSDAVKSDQVGGSVHAVAGPHATMRAIANSNNRLETELDVNDSGTYSFILTLSLNKCKIKGTGTLGVYIRSNVLDDSGLVVKGGEVAFTDMALSSDASKAIIAGDTAHALPLDGGGNLLRATTGPVGGVKLHKGIYHLGMNLRILATAQPGSSAEVGSATLKVALHQGPP